MVIAGVVAWAKIGKVGVAVTTIVTIGLQARTAKNSKQAAIAMAWIEAFLIMVAPPFILAVLFALSLRLTTTYTVQPWAGEESHPCIERGLLVACPRFFKIPSEVSDP